MKEKTCETCKNFIKHDCDCDKCEAPDECDMVVIALNNIEVYADKPACKLYKEVK
jgi:hypothetical protein